VEWKKYERKMDRFMKAEGRNRFQGWELVLPFPQGRREEQERANRWAGGRIPVGEKLGSGI